MRESTRCRLSNGAVRADAAQTILTFPHFELGAALVRLVTLLLLLTWTLIARAQVFYVVNGLDESLGWVDVQQNQSVQNAVTLGNLPNDVVVTESNLFVVNSGLGTVQVIDRLSMQTSNEFPIAGAVNPYSAAFMDASRLAVTGFLSGTVSIVDVPAGTVDTTFSTGIAPQAVLCSDGVLHVLNTGVAFPEFHPGTLKRYNQTFELIDSVEVGVNPQGLVLINDDIHIVCTGNYDDIGGSIVILDRETLVIDTVLQVGGSPAAISASGNDVYVAAGGWVTEGLVYRYNAETRAVLNDDDNPIVCGVGATDVVAMPNEKFAVTCFGDARLEIRSASGSLVTGHDMLAGTGALGVWWGQSTVEPERHEVPIESSLLAYPNPFNGIVTLGIFAPIRGSAEIVITDILGREVERLALGIGQTTAVWNPGFPAIAEVAAGTYWARLDLAEQTQATKIIYLK